MKNYFYFFTIIILSIIACKTTAEEEKITPTPPKEVVVDTFQTILDAADVEGSILIYDADQNIYYSNNFERTDSGFLPASTFKIPNSLIALEIGVMEHDSILIKWDGKKRWLKAWNQDLVFRDAFHYSCVNCYQKIAREVGLEKMKDYMKKFQYGNMIIDSSTLDLFWLTGDSKITQKEQVDFLQRFYDSELPISGRTEAIAKRMMAIEQDEELFYLAKTGLTEEGLGWYVGYVEKEGNPYFFATHIQPKGEIDYSSRRLVSEKALQHLEILSVSE